VTSHRSPSGRYHNWEQIVATLRLTPGVWALRLVNQPTRLARTVNDRSAPALRIEDGRIEAKIVNSYTDSDNRRRGDVYLRYMPAQQPSEGETP